MIINKVIGKLADLKDHHERESLTIERVILSWDELQKRILRKTTDVGRDIGIQLEIGHLHSGDILFREDNHVIVIEVKEESVMVVPVRTMVQMGLAAHAIGNMHAPIQVTSDAVVTPYNPVVQDQLRKIGLSPFKEERVFVP